MGPCMKDVQKTGNDTAALSAEFVAHLARLAYGEGHVCGLTNAQWTALRYFGRANRFSRTLLAFAAYHVTTRGTASQTVKSLVTKGLLVRTRSQHDARSSRIDLTTKGEALCEKDPFKGLVHAIAGLPETEQAKLSPSLDQITGRITSEQQRRQFGTCHRCRFLEEFNGQERGKKTWFCVLADQPIQRSEFNGLCIKFRQNVA